MNHTRTKLLPIVLASDYNYRKYVETTIKSIMLYHENVHFILLNKDYPAEWFIRLNQELLPFQSKIEDKKIAVKDYQNFKTYSYITEATFYRYHIAEIAYDKVLYLDSDLIVTGSLDSLYETDIEDYGLGAVADTCVRYFHGKKEFNAGVLLINNRKWKAERVLEKALLIHQDSRVELPDADQTVLNMLFKDNWLELDPTYNVQVCAVFPGIGKKYGLYRGVILHFTTRAKPYTKARIFIRTGFKHWRKKEISLKTYLKNIYEVPFADDWHQVHQLSWDEIVQENRREN
ncbi:glycosyltransferase family 8 protein [Streptococcus pneumoniae]